MNEKQKVIICKSEDSSNYEVWKKFEMDILDFVESFKTLIECIEYCEKNNFVIENFYGSEKEYK